MTIEVKVIPNARKVKVEKDGEKYKVYVNAPAVDGKANKALIEILAAHFDLKKSQINIIRGETARIKIIKLES